MDIKKRLHLLQKSDIPIEMVHEALHDSYYIVQANALLGLGKRLQHFPEFRTNTWLDELEIIINSTNAKTEIFGDVINLYTLCLYCVNEIKTEKSRAYFSKHFAKLRPKEQRNLNRLIEAMRQDD